jgi:hypothetical protein
MSVISSRSLRFSVAGTGGKDIVPPSSVPIIHRVRGKLRDDHQTIQRSAVALLRVCNGGFGLAVAANPGGWTEELVKVLEAVQVHAYP